MQSTAGETFPRSSRLVTSKHFQQVFKSNRRVQDDCFTLLVSKHPSDKPRLGFAIAKKQVKRAVDRNRLKRLVRESFRLNQSSIPDRDFVVMVRNKILLLSNEQIAQRLQTYWRKASRT